jgi:acetylornithine deacetylase
MGRVLARLERLDRHLQAREPHPLMGTGSLHASIIEGGRELSSYPDRCRLQVERRTVPGETVGTFAAEIEAVLAELRDEDSDIEVSSSIMFSRAPYEVPAGHSLTGSLAAAAASTGFPVSTTGMSFWTDAAVLGSAGIPSLLFGPGGAGLHSVEEYVKLDEVVACRDALAALALEWP